jgi:hypothetical protein
MFCWDGNTAQYCVGTVGPHYHALGGKACSQSYYKGLSNIGNAVKHDCPPPLLLCFTTLDKGLDYEDTVSIHRVQYELFLGFDPQKPISHHRLVRISPFKYVCAVRLWAHREDCCLRALAKKLLKTLQSLAVPKVLCQKIDFTTKSLSNC